MLTLYLIRHAQSEQNVKWGVMGGTNNHVDLTEKGRKQADLLGKRIKDMHFDVIYASVANRALQTAQIALTHHPKDFELITSEELVERSWGEWSDKPINEVLTPQALRRLRASPATFKAPSGESYDDVTKRYLAFFEREILPQAATDQTIAVFGHGTTFRCLVAHILGADPGMIWRMELDNTGIIHLEYDDDGWRMMTYNDASHLPDDFR